jgi:hypothetical protein
MVAFIETSEFSEVDGGGWIKDGKVEFRNSWDHEILIRR